MFFVPAADHVGVMLFVIKNRNISFPGHEQITFQSIPGDRLAKLFNDFCF